MKFKEDDVMQIDSHTAEAARRLGIPPEQVTREQRAQVKADRFGEMYGLVQQPSRTHRQEQKVPVFEVGATEVGATEVVYDLKAEKERILAKEAWGGKTTRAWNRWHREYRLQHPIRARLSKLAQVIAVSSIVVAGIVLLIWG